MKKYLFALAALSLLMACTPEENGADNNQSGNGEDKIVHVTGISLDRNSATIKEGESITLVATVTPANADNKSVSWSSSSDAVATVNAEGKVTAVSKGAATIKAEAKDGSGKYASCSVTVEGRPVTSIELNKTSLVLYRGTSNVTETLTATVTPSDASNTAVTWTSSNTSVATVSSSDVVTGKARGTAIRVTANDGSMVVTGKSKGTATIMVTANDGNGAQATCAVEVKQYVTSISLDKTSLPLAIGDEVTLSVTILPDNANDKTYTWSSSDSAIASVDNSGKVTAKAKGKATIKATANDGSGVFASCTVRGVKELYTAFAGEAVDLGLSVKWSSTNLGATSPSDYGDYFAWGENAPKDNYSWATYELCNGSSSTLTKYNNRSSYGAVDHKSEFKDYFYEDDAARQALGGKWRVPTDAEWTELRTKCTWTWTTNYNGTGVSGRIVTATNGNSIFLPAAGYRTDTSLGAAGSSGKYWSSSNLNLGYQAWPVDFNSGFVDRHPYDRCYGRSVRPVSE